MKELIQEGKITHWGISEANEDYLRRADAVCHVTAIQNRLSMMYRDYEETLPGPGGTEGWLCGVQPPGKWVSDSLLS